MAILNKSKTALTEKDYWRTPDNLINDALRLLGINGFDVDVCCLIEAVQISKSDWCLLERQNALNDRDWFSDFYSDCSRPKFTTSFCNPPFSLKYEFFQKAIEQVQKFGKQVLFVMPYTPTTKAWRKNIDAANCIVYVPDGRYNYILPDGKETKGGCNFDTCLVLIVPFFTNGAKYINYERGLNG